ncbi:MAG: hypothetical protein WC750_05920 [Patescibacteria group bacterium]|jgi:hypothetical protein
MTPEKAPEMGKEVGAPNPAQVPATMGSMKLGRGHEEPSEMDELEIPRAKLVQFTSGEAKAQNKDDKRDAGVLINSLTKEALGEFFIPIFKFTNFIQWNPMKKEDPNFDPAFEKGEMVFSTSERRDPRVVEGIKFGPNGEAPKVTKYMNFLCYFVGHTYPLVLSFAKTSFAAGKRLNTLTQVGGGDMFSCKYKLVVEMKENAGQSFFVLDVKPAGKATEEEFKIAEHWYEEFRGKNIKVHTDGEQAPAAGEGPWPE